MTNYNERLYKILEQRDARLATLRRGYEQNRLGWTVDDGSAEQELYEKENKIKAEAKAKLQRLMMEARLDEVKRLERHITNSGDEDDPMDEWESDIYCRVFQLTKELEDE